MPGKHTHASKADAWTWFATIGEGINSISANFYEGYSMTKLGFDIYNWATDQECDASLTAFVIGAILSVQSLGVMWTHFRKNTYLQEHEHHGHAHYCDETPGESCHTPGIVLNNGSDILTASLGSFSVEASVSIDIKKSMSDSLVTPLISADKKSTPEEKKSSSSTVMISEALLKSANEMDLPNDPLPLTTCDKVSLLAEGITHTFDVTGAEQVLLDTVCSVTKTTLPLWQRGLFSAAFHVVGIAAAKGEVRSCENAIKSQNKLEHKH